MHLICFGHIVDQLPFNSTCSWNNEYIRLPCTVGCCQNDCRVANSCLLKGPSGQPFWCITDYGWAVMSVRQICDDCPWDRVGSSKWLLMISMSIVYHFYFILSTIIHIIVEISSADLQNFRYRSISLKGALLMCIFIDNWLFFTCTMYVVLALLYFVFCFCLALIDLIHITQGFTITQRRITMTQPAT